MQVEKFWQRRWFRLALIVGIWTLFGLLFASQLYLAASRTSRPLSLRRVLLLEMSYAYLWAVLTPLMLWLASRYRLERQNWRRHLCLHLFAATVIGFTMLGLHYLLTLNILAPPGARFSTSSLLHQAFSYFDYGMLTYWVILLGSHGFDYYRRFQEGELRASQLEANLAQAQLQALKMQLQPHFLFNTLHSISALLHKDAETADKMIARLGDFLRMTLENSGSHEVTLQEELEFLKCYLEIERIRFRDRLTVQLDIDPQTLGALVPNMILQPLVENAIKHGISAHAGQGRIKVRASRHDGYLQIGVNDNGPGLQNESYLSFHEGVGLANTQARLQQLYGRSHRLYMDDSSLGGLSVTLEIPFKCELQPRVERLGGYRGSLNGGKAVTSAHSR